MPKMLQAFMVIASFVAALPLAGSTQGLASEPAGIWRGEWSSQSTGHRGPMRAHVRPRNDGSYDVRYAGRFALVIPFTYKVNMKHQPADNLWVASKSLGPLLGSYQMSTSFSGNQMLGQFQAAKDVGQVQMHRVR